MGYRLSERYTRIVKIEQCNNYLSGLAILRNVISYNCAVGKCQLTFTDRVVPREISYLSINCNQQAREIQDT